METHICKLSRLCALAGLIATVAGCSHGNAALTGTTPPPATPVASGAAQDPIANNPAAGKPNHLSPEMQAMISHYQSVGGN